jgi:hypothetical protein
VFSFEHKNRDGNVGCAATAFGSMANILNSKSDRFNSSLVLPLLQYAGCFVAISRDRGVTQSYLAHFLDQIEFFHSYYWNQV